MFGQSGNWKALQKYKAMFGWIDVRQWCLQMPRRNDQPGWLMQTRLAYLRTIRLVGTANIVKLCNTFIGFGKIELKYNCANKEVNFIENKRFKTPLRTWTEDNFTGWPVQREVLPIGVTSGWLYELVWPQASKQRQCKVEWWLHSACRSSLMVHFSCFKTNGPQISKLYI